MRSLLGGRLSNRSYSYRIPKLGISGYMLRLVAKYVEMAHSLQNMNVSVSRSLHNHQAPRRRRLEK